MSSLARSSLPALIHDSHIFVSGNVVIHPSAAIAPSVMLQADPGSQLIVGEGVCIGVGCILHAHQGLVEVEKGATLGSGVLIVGQGKIGANACIGAMTTIIDSSVLAGEIVPPGSLIGDWSRQAITVESSESSAAAPQPASQGRSASPSQHSASGTSASGASATQGSAQQAANDTEKGSEPERSTDEAGVKVVYGRASVERMMITMFPHRKLEKE
jgi:carbon dioxide concentrating mechanism protein CcmN